MENEKRMYSYISFEKRKQLIDAAENKNESVKACAIRLGVRYITAKQIIKRFRQTGKIAIKGWKKENSENFQKKEENKTQKPEKEIIDDTKIPSVDIKKNEGNFTHEARALPPLPVKECIPNNNLLMPQNGGSLMYYSAFMPYYYVPVMQQIIIYMPLQPINIVAGELNKEYSKECKKKLGERVMKKFEL